LRIEVVLEKGELSAEQFKQDTLQSNTIWINGRLLRTGLGADGTERVLRYLWSNDVEPWPCRRRIHEVVPVETDRQGRAPGGDEFGRCCIMRLLPASHLAGRRLLPIIMSVADANMAKMAVILFCWHIHQHVSDRHCL